MATTRRPLIAGNWKLFKTASEAERLVGELIPKVSGLDVDVVVCPPFTALDRVRGVIEDAKGTPIALGAQNVYWEEEGAFTGEIAPGMLRDLGVRYVTVGHSERRQYFGETNETVGLRALAALAHGIIPIICVGELLNQREAGETEAVIQAQLEGALKGIDEDQASSIAIAYEPVWAIGTGKVATPDEAQAVHAFIRSFVRAKYGDAVAGGLRIQYGGSVKPENAAELLSQLDIDGALVGGASLKADSFAAIAAAAVSGS